MNGNTTTWQKKCVYEVASWLLAYRTETGWTRAGLARALTEKGKPYGLQVSASSLENLEGNLRDDDDDEYGDGDSGYRHARKPWDRTLKTLLLIRSMPDEIRSMIEDLLDYEGRCLVDEIGLPGALPRVLPGALPRVLVPAT